MSRIAIMGYGPSESVSLLATDLRAQGRHSCTKLRREGSVFRGRRGDVILNWGSGRELGSIVGQATVLNSPEAVNRAANKISALNAMRDAGVSVVDFATDRATAQRWVDAGDVVFVRNQLRGHSGAGIVAVCSQAPNDLGNVEHSTTLPQAQLYTRGVSSQHREYRIHVFKGQPIFVQQKRRSNGYSDNPNYSNVVRNHGNGWIYAHGSLTPIIPAAVENAVLAVQALGLDFGAVDVLTRGDDCWVLEVNTAPGQSGETNRATYVAAILATVDGREVTRGTFPVASSSSSARNRGAGTRQEPEPTPDLEPTPAPTTRSRAADPEPTPAPAATTRRASSQPQTRAADGVGSLQNDRFYLIEVGGERDVAWYDGATRLLFPCKNVGAHPANAADVTVIREVATA